VRALRACCLGAVVVLLGASAARADVGGGTPAAAPFASAWARVPATTGARKAAKAVVFAASMDVVGGFNTVLGCCNSTWSYWLGPAEALRGAFAQNAHGEWIPDLVSDARATRTTLSYTIKSNANWYWGGRKIPVTYKDFVYTLQQIDDVHNDVVGRAGFGNLDPTRFTHKGLKQVTFFWRTKSCSTDFPCGAYANWQSLFTNLYPSFALAGLDFNKIWTSCICGPDGKPVADGPFYLAGYTPGQGVVLEANPYFYKRPQLAEIDFRVITDPSVEVATMQGGQVDAIYPPFVSDLLPLKTTAGLVYDQAPVDSLEHIELREGNAKAGPTVSKGSSNVLLRAPWMREAISLALDRQAMIDTLYGPLAAGLKPTDSLLFFSTHAGYEPDFGRWNYNPAKSLAIMKAHCTGGPAAPSPGNAKVWQCAGLPATFRYVWPVASRDRTTVEQLAKADLKAVGIALTERPLPPNVIFGPDGIPSGDFDLAEFALFTTGDPGDWYDQFRCFGVSNYSGYCSRAVDALLTAANGELDPERRAALYERADAIMATQVPAIPLFQKPGPLVHKSGLVGIAANPSLDGPFWNVEDWHWKR
jgi:peptide/nickel transport system substrate-binding protein